MRAACTLLMCALVAGCDARCGRLDASRNPERRVLANADVDCAGGLARCRAGVVEVSVAGMVPAAEACEFSPAGQCAQACVVEGLVLAAEPAAARVRLCAGGARALLLEAVVTEPERAAEDYTCTDGVVRAGAGAALARCLRGCAAPVLQTDGLTPRLAAELLCAPE